MFKIIFNKMDSFELNKIIAAVLMVALLVIGIGKLSDVIFHIKKPKTPGYAVNIEEAITASATSSESVEEKIDIAALMSIGDLAVGEKVACWRYHFYIEGGSWALQVLRVPRYM